MKTYAIRSIRYRHNTDELIRTEYTGTLDELVEKFSYTLLKGQSWQHEFGNKKINTHPTTIRSLISNLNNAETNAARNGCADTYYELAV